MSAGYVYILINSSMPGLVKVGRTLRDSRARARQLNTTGVPTPFEVAFEVFADDHEALEARVHEQLADFRVSGNREFFRYPLADATRMLQPFIGNGRYDSRMFPSTDDVLTNAQKFVGQFDPYSICMTTDLFHRAACEEVAVEHNPHRA